MYLDSRMLQIWPRPEACAPSLTLLLACSANAGQTSFGSFQSIAPSRSQPVDICLTCQVSVCRSSSGRPLLFLPDIHVELCLDRLVTGHVHWVLLKASLFERLFPAFLPSLAAFG